MLRHFLVNHPGLPKVFLNSMTRKNIVNNQVYRNFLLRSSRSFSVSSKKENDVSQTQNTPTPTTSTITPEQVDITTNDSSFASFWKRYTGPRPEHPRWTKWWYAEMIYRCVMFGVTGSLALVIVRYIMQNGLEIDASLFRGEWYHRILYFCIMFPTYSACTYVVGTAFGRHVYAKKLVHRMWSRWGKLGKLILRR